MEIEKKYLQTPSKAPDGNLRSPLTFSCFQVSEALSKSLLRYLEKMPNWIDSQPILLGSWGRGELTPKSDLDVLFLGPEKTVLEVVQDLEKQGLRIRYRVPENPADWTVGVEIPDVLALWKAQALNPEVRVKLSSMQDKIFSSKIYQKKILSTLVKERKERNERFDSISNYLEPNLKYGAGGLRDLFQAQVLLDLFSDQFSDIDHERKILQYYLGFFLSLRQKLHFDGFSDVLVGSEQPGLARWFGFETHHEFMRQIQRGISRVSFYSDWIVERSSASQRRIAEIEKTSLKTPAGLVSILAKDPSVLRQHQVRREIDPVFGRGSRPKVSAKVRFQLLDQILSVSAEETWLTSVFRSRLIDKLCPRLTRLVGYVQHDQYHRFTADTHIMQACREMKRVFEKPQTLGALKKLVKSLSSQDWKILSWTCLYHDLAKGLPQADHSEIGLKWVREDFRKAGLSNKLAEEVAWLVGNHLALSQAAFRKNPRAPETWQELWDLGLTEKRLLRLAIFTAVDIRATNPDAWNDWKSKLLASLVETLRSGETQSFLKIQKKLENEGLNSRVLKAIDRDILLALRPEQLMKDLQQCLSEEGRWEVYRDRKKKIWVRFHQNQDHPGLLAQILSQLYSAGCSTQHALIHTLPELGVYDWFQVQTNRELPRLKKLLDSLRSVEVAKPDTPFLDVQVISQSEEEWVISFKGVDQKGLLLRAVLELKELGCNIRSARVHTWGRQVEDLFHVKPLPQGAAEFLKTLRVHLNLK